MKGKILLGALLLVAGALAGCSSSQGKNVARAAVAAHAATKLAEDHKNDSAQSSDSNVSSRTTDSKSTSDAIKQSVQAEEKNGFKAVVTKMENVTASIPYANASTNYIAVTVEMTNNTKQAMSYQVMAFRALDENKQPYQIDANTFGAANELKDGYVNPNSKTTGVLIFALPSSATQLFLQYSATDNPYDNSWVPVPYVGQNAVQQK